MDRFALIADVHGNRWALEAVLEDIARRGVGTILNAGDHLFGPLDVAGTADLLMGSAGICVAGNQDREMVEDPKGLSSRHLEWLAAMPSRLEISDDILLFHGTPERDDVYLLETVRADGAVVLASDADIGSRLGSVERGLMLCGHTHLPRCVWWGGRLVVNPGSVGLQAYWDDLPVAHVMETGCPLARYGVVERVDGGWRVEYVALPYDLEAAAGMAEKNGRDDWAWRLRTGRAIAG